MKERERESMGGRVVKEEPRVAWHETPRLNWVSGALRRVLNVVFSLQPLPPYFF